MHKHPQLISNTCLKKQRVVYNLLSFYVIINIKSLTADRPPIILIIMLLHKGGNGGGIENGRGIKDEIVKGNGNGDGNGIGNGIGKSVSEKSVSEKSVSADFAIGTHTCLRKIIIGLFRSRSNWYREIRYGKISVSEQIGVRTIQYRTNSTSEELGIGKHRYQK